MHFILVPQATPLPCTWRLQAGLGEAHCRELVHVYVALMPVPQAPKTHVSTREAAAALRVKFLAIAIPAQASSVFNMHHFINLLCCWAAPRHAVATAAQENGGDDADIQRTYQTAMNRWQAVLHEEALAAAVSPAARARPHLVDTPDSAEAGVAAEEQQLVRAGRTVLFNLRHVLLAGACCNAGAAPGATSTVVRCVGMA